MSVLLEARAVTMQFGGGLRGPRMKAVDDFSLAIADQPPSITALVGESGSGKTTLARLLLGLIEPSEGAVLYKGANIRTLSGADLRAFRRDVQVIFQDPFEAYNPFYRIDHVLETPVLNFGLAGSKREARAMIEATLRAVGLRPEETLGRYPHQLSGGQRQRIMVARALLIRSRWSTPRSARRS
jgi:peptide/nickel transport system ATP-binding protein